MTRLNTSLSRDALRDHARRSRAERTKQQFVEDVCRGRRVLDVGCIDHSADNALAAGDRWLHHRVREVADSVVGIDILAEDADRLNELGYSIVVADAEGFDLGERFDVVLAADVVEHLGNPGNFFRAAHAHLAGDGILAITTPNPFSLALFVHVLLTGQVPVNEEHVGWLDPTVLHELLRRSGFTVEGFAWLESPMEGPSARSRLLDALARPLVRLRPMFQRNFGMLATPLPV